MKTQRRSQPLTLALALMFLTFSLGMRTEAQTENLLFSFGDNSGGYAPATLASDSAGNLYGTGGAGNGMVYKMTLTAGVWGEKAIHFFSGGVDGADPSSSVLFDADGNLYGTTTFGGKSAACPTSGCSGVVFELSPTVSGPWKFTALHTFIGGADGASPIGIVFDAAGNIFGMTQTGGSTAGVCANDSGCGTVFKLSPKSGGGWQYSLIHTFSATDGLLPQGNLLVDSSGNLYGSTTFGGNANYCKSDNFGGCGVVFRLAPTVKGGYGIALLHRFINGADGSLPSTPLVFDGAGNLYGATGNGGASNPYGTVFELSPTVGGAWTFAALYSPTGGTDGESTNGGLAIDSAGNLYGSSIFGGNPECNCGTVFKLAPGAGGWTVDLLHDFGGGFSDGFYPAGNLVVNSSGDLYGVTFQGGAYEGGTLYEIAP